MVLSGKPKHALYDTTPAFLESTSPILLKHKTIQHLQELSQEISIKDKQNIVTYDDLITDMIRVYRAKKRLSDLWP